MDSTEKKLVYDPTKTYVWDAEDKFIVTGADIDAWNKALVQLTNSEEFYKFLVVQNAAMKMGRFIETAVETGLIKEKVNTQQEKE